MQNNKRQSQQKLLSDSLRLSSHRQNILTEEEAQSINQQQNKLVGKQTKFEKIKYKFQQKNEDYIQQTSPSRISAKSDYIIKHKVESEKLIQNRSRLFNKHSKQKEFQISKQKQETYQSIDIQKKEYKVQSLKFDYDNIYKQIRLMPTYQQNPDKQQTIQIQQKQQPNINQQINQQDITYHQHQTSPQKSPLRYKNIQQIKNISEININPVTDFYQNIQNKKINVFQQNKQTKIDQSFQTQTILNKFIEKSNQTKQQLNQVEQTQNKKMVDSEQQTAQIFKEENFQKSNPIEIKIVPFQSQSNSKEDLIEKYQKSKSYYLPKISDKQKYIESGQTQRSPYKDHDTKNNEDSNVSMQEKANKTIKDNNQSKEELQRTQKNKIIQQPKEKIDQEEVSEEFDFSIYIKIYNCLKSIQNNLRNPFLLKNLKSYLQLIASGKVDKFEYIRIPLHKKKILKNSLLYQRVTIIVIAFSYVSDTLNDSYKYLSNLLKFAMNNHIIILKILITEYNKKIPQSLNNELKQVLLQMNNKQSQTKGYQIMRDNNEILQETIFRLSKYDNLFYQNLKKFIKNSNKFTIEQTFYFILEYFAFFLNICEMGQKIPFLSVAPNPYLPVIQNKKYTLVIDFLDIMCNPKKTDGFRPYSQYFLDEMSEYYEIIIFSIAFPNQINKVIENLDRKKKITHKLYRHHAIKSNGIYLKDLTRLGRDMSKTILIDSQYEQYRLNKQNSIGVHQWTGRNKDTALAELCPMLAMIVLKNMDVRQALGKYKQQMIKNMNSGVKYINYGMNLD